MSECGEWGLGLLLAPLALVVLAAAGVAAAAVAVATAAGRVVSADELEGRLHSVLRAEHQSLLSRYLQPTATPLQRQSMEGLARAEAVQRALAAQLPLQAIAERWQEQSLQRAQRILQEAQELYRTDAWEQAWQKAREAEQRVTEAAYDAHRRLARAQRDVVAQTVGRSLQGMEYALQSSADERGAALWARRNERAMALVVGDGGRMRMDMAGFDGIRCRQEAERLIRSLREEGVEVHRESVVLHGRRGGGALIPAAARRVRETGMEAAPALLEVATGAKAAQGEAPRGHGSSQDRARAWLWMQQQQTIR